MESIKKVLIISNDSNLKSVLTFCLDGWGYEVFTLDFSKPPAELNLEQIIKYSPDTIVLDIESAGKEQLEICRRLKYNFTTAFIPVITLIDKRQLRAQLLNLKQGIDDYLIKPPDPLDLRIRIEMIMKRAQHNIQANPLTGLPGGKILEETLKERLKTKEVFSFAYLDLDNFKYFNDAYGYQKGDRVILQTAYMLANLLKGLGNQDDFLGHIGGDDFAFITTPDKYEPVCSHFTQMFDNIIPFHYSAPDRQQGFIVARDRARKIKRIPLISVSIAIVNKDASFNFKNTLEINEKIVEIKRYLKTIPESKFMADRRDAKLTGHAFPQVHRKNNSLNLYKPLGQILFENKVISYEQLDEALNIHWRRGVSLGETLKYLGFINEEQLKAALNTQNINFSCPVFKNQ